VVSSFFVDENAGDPFVVLRLEPLTRTKERNCAAKRCAIRLEELLSSTLPLAHEIGSNQER
jgi:hypothetical protein